METNSQPHILKGLAPREALREKLALQVRAFSSVPKLVIIQVGDREDSNVYIKQKIDFGRSIGVDVIHKKFPGTTTQDELQKEIESLNADSSVTAMIVQLPLPSHIPTSVLECIESKKDVDCLTEYHQEQLAKGAMYSSPATAKAVLTLLTYYKVPIIGKHAVVIGRSTLAGGPIAELLKISGAAVSVIHRETKNPQELSCTADILVVACGVPRLVTKEWVNSSLSTTVIDVGIHRSLDGLVGDVDADSVYPYVHALSPVPGGVGPLTVACLFEQLVHIHMQNTDTSSLSHVV